MKQTNSNLNTLLIILCITLLAALSWHWYRSLAWVEKSRIVATRASQLNPLLATEIWLEHTNRSVNTINQVAKILELDQDLRQVDALIIWGNINFFTQKQHRQIRHFIESGGHLIFEIPDSRVDTHNFFSLIHEFGIIPWHESSATNDENSSKHNPKKDYNTITEDWLKFNNAEHIGLQMLRDCFSHKYVRGPIAVPNSTGWACLNQATPFNLLDSNQATQFVPIEGQDNKILMATFKAGSGTLTAFSSMDHFNNRGPMGVLSFDHAWWLDSLLGDANRVLLIQHYDATSLWTLIKRFLPFTGLSILLLALIWAASVFPRFGPIAPVPTPSCRSLGDHLRASIEVLRRHKRVDALLQYHFNSICREFPSLSGLPYSQKFTRLGSLTGCDPKALFDIVDPNVPYLKRVKRLQQLRKSL